MPLLIPLAVRQYPDLRYLFELLEKRKGISNISWARTNPKREEKVEKKQSKNAPAIIPFNVIVAIDRNVLPGEFINTMCRGG